MRRHIADEADARLAFYLPPPPPPPELANDPAYVPPEMPERPKLAEGVTDTPLVRVYNFLRMLRLPF